MEKREFERLLSFGDAAAIWGLDASTLRHAVATGRLREGSDCRKYGKQWIVRVSAMCRIYGAKQYERWISAGRKLPAGRKQPQQIEGQITLTEST